MGALCVFASRITSSGQRHQRTNLITDRVMTNRITAAYTESRGGSHDLPAFGWTGRLAFGMLAYHAVVRHHCGVPLLLAGDQTVAHGDV